MIFFLEKETKKLKKYYKYYASKEIGVKNQEEKQTKESQLIIKY